MGGLASASFLLRSRRGPPRHHGPGAPHMPRTIGDQTRTSILVCRIAGERLQEFLQLVNDFEDAPPRFCLEREVWLKVREPEVYCLVERWPNLASLRSHQA